MNPFFSVNSKLSWAAIMFGAGFMAFNPDTCHSAGLNASHSSHKSFRQCIHGNHSGLSICYWADKCHDCRRRVQYGRMVAVKLHPGRLLSYPYSSQSSFLPENPTFVTINGSELSQSIVLWMSRHMKFCTMGSNWSKITRGCWRVQRGTRMPKDTCGFTKGPRLGLVWVIAIMMMTFTLPR